MKVILITYGDDRMRSRRRYGIVENTAIGIILRFL